MAYQHWTKVPREARAFGMIGAALASCASPIKGVEGEAMNRSAYLDQHVSHSSSRPRRFVPRHGPCNRHCKRTWLVRVGSASESRRRQAEGKTGRPVSRRWVTTPVRTMRWSSSLRPASTSRSVGSNSCKSGHQTNLLRAFFRIRGLLQRLNKAVGLLNRQVQVLHQVGDLQVELSRRPLQ